LIISNYLIFPEWNVQLAVSEKQCKTFKEIAETLEKNLQENEEKFLRERNRLQELCDTANVQHREGQTTIENLRAEISEMQGQFSSREAELEHKINEWKAQVAEMEKEKLELGAQLDNLEGELTVVRNREEELRSELSQVRICRLKTNNTLLETN
jgi:chromosome segregation ATPase